MDQSNQVFKMDELGPQARRIKLDPKQGMALAMALELAAKVARRRGETSGDSDEAREDELRDFLLPYAEFGLDSAQMLGLLEKVPQGWRLSHREMYYDFRLARWQKHIEPPTIAESLEEYLENSPTPQEGMDYLRAQWAEFLKRHGAA